ncbi:hypothetical protein GGE07_002738 [Sinorhizobium terangae]|nr:hypothetical protein [Sinorhizobium terangae]
MVNPALEGDSEQDEGKCARFSVGIPLNLLESITMKA